MGRLTEGHQPRGGAAQPARWCSGELVRFSRRLRSSTTTSYALLRRWRSEKPHSKLVCVFVSKMCTNDLRKNRTKSVRKTGWLLQNPAPTLLVSSKGHTGASGVELTAVGQVWPLLWAMSSAVEWCGHSEHTRPQQHVQHTCQPEQRC